jgi:hypothetical protein
MRVRDERVRPHGPILADPTTEDDKAGQHLVWRDDLWRGSAVHVKTRRIRSRIAFGKSPRKGSVP